MVAACSVSVPRFTPATNGAMASSFSFSAIQPVSSAEQRHGRRAALAAQLAAHQVHRLHAIGAFIDHG